MPPGFYRKTRGIHRIGTRALQPAANTTLEGTLYFVTDEKVLERSTGVGNTWVAYSGVNIPGATTQVLFNDAGVVAGDAGLVYNKTTDALTAGSLVLTNGQIVFPATQVASANANTLDDYEEGTWTPVLGGDGGESGQTYTTQAGSYTKIGNVCTALFFVTLSVKGTITGNAVIKGLPFASNAYYAATTIGYWVTSTGFVFLGGSANPFTSAIYLRGLTVAGSLSANVTTANLANGNQIIGSFTYQTG